MLPLVRPDCFPQKQLFLGMSDLGRFSGRSDIFLYPQKNLRSFTFSLFGITQPCFFLNFFLWDSWDRYEDGPTHLVDLLL
jgi:hypothetical protein